MQCQRCTVVSPSTTNSSSTTEKSGKRHPWRQDGARCGALPTPVAGFSGPRLVRGGGTARASTVRSEVANLSHRCAPGPPIPTSTGQCPVLAAARPRAGWPTDDDAPGRWPDRPRAAVTELPAPLPRRAGAELTAVWNWALAPLPTSMFVGRLTDTGPATRAELDQWLRDVQDERGLAADCWPELEECTDEELAELRATVGWEGPADAATVMAEEVAEQAAQLARTDRYSAALGRPPVRAFGDLLDFLVAAGVLTSDDGRYAASPDPPPPERVLPLTAEDAARLDRRSREHRFRLRDRSSRTVRPVRPGPARPAAHQPAAAGPPAGHRRGVRPPGGAAAARRRRRHRHGRPDGRPRAPGLRAGRGLAALERRAHRHLRMPGPA